MIAVACLVFPLCSRAPPTPSRSHQASPLVLCWPCTKVKDEVSHSTKLALTGEVRKANKVQGALLEEKLESMLDGMPTSDGKLARRTTLYACKHAIRFFCVYEIHVTGVGMFLLCEEQEAQEDQGGGGEHGGSGAHRGEELGQALRPWCMRPQRMQACTRAHKGK